MEGSKTYSMSSFMLCFPQYKISNEESLEKETIALRKKKNPYTWAV